MNLVKSEAGQWIARLRWDSDVVLEAQGKTIQAALRQLANDITEERYVEVVTAEDAA